MMTGERWKMVEVGDNQAIDNLLPELSGQRKQAMNVTLIRQKKSSLGSIKVIQHVTAWLRMVKPGASAHFDKRMWRGTVRKRASERVGERHDHSPLIPSRHRCSH